MTRGQSGSLFLVAAAHHERLDGHGYWRNWDATQLTTPARILAVADVFDALSARRPYRDGLPLETVFGMIHKDAPQALDAECVEALEMSGVETESSLVALSKSVIRPHTAEPVSARRL